jgi:hypothetical protein
VSFTLNPIHATVSSAAPPLPMYGYELHILHSNKPPFSIGRSEVFPLQNYFPQPSRSVIANKASRLHQSEGLLAAQASERARTTFMSKINIRPTMMAQSELDDQVLSPTPANDPIPQGRAPPPPPYLPTQAGMTFYWQFKLWGNVHSIVNGNYNMRPKILPERKKMKAEYRSKKVLRGPNCNRFWPNFCTKNRQKMCAQPLKQQQNYCKVVAIPNATLSFEKNLFCTRRPTLKTKTFFNLLRQVIC